MILIYITCKDKKQAKNISKNLLEKRLVACTNIHPIESMYWWENKIQEDNEVVIIAKTKEENYEKVKQEVVLGEMYEIWDVITDKNRWWVITNLTNLYRVSGIEVIWTT